MSVIKVLRDLDGLFNYSTDENPTSQQDYQKAVKNWVKTIVSLVDSNLWQPETEYTVGSQLLTPSLPYYVLRCTVAGTSGAAEPDYTDVALDDEITDGTVTWVVDGYLPLSGGTLTGVVNGVTPTAGDNSTKIATTEFVNAKAGNYLPLSGGTMTGAINTANNTWNKLGDDVFFGDRNVAGKMCIKSRNYVNPGIAFFNQSDTKVGIVDVNNAFDFNMPVKEKGGFLVPIGVVQSFAGSTTPQGWLLCDGSAVSRTDYAALFAVIGTTYGAGNGSTTFNLPNLVDKFVEGSATAGTVKSAGLPNITGGGQVTAWKDISYYGAFVSEKRGSTTNTGGSADNNYFKIDFDASRSSAIYGNSNTVQPPALTMRYIIKY